MLFVGNTHKETYKINKDDIRLKSSRYFGKVYEFTTNRGIYTINEKMYSQNDFAKIEDYIKNMNTFYEQDEDDKEWEMESNVLEDGKLLQPDTEGIVWLKYSKTALIGIKKIIFLLLSLVIISEIVIVLVDTFRGEIDISMTVYIIRFGLLFLLSSIVYLVMIFTRQLGIKEEHLYIKDIFGIVSDTVENISSEDGIVDIKNRSVNLSKEHSFDKNEFNHYIKPLLQQIIDK